MVDRVLYSNSEQQHYRVDLYLKSGNLLLKNEHQEDALQKNSHSMEYQKEKTLGED